MKTKIKQEQLLSSIMDICISYKLDDNFNDLENYLKNIIEIHDKEYIDEISLLESLIKEREDQIFRS